MTDQKKCHVCGKNESKKWIERQNTVGIKAYFCSKECYLGYRKKSEASGVCEFC